MQWRRAAGEGALIGLAGAASFFALHAAIVEPIWRPDALLRGALHGPAAGAVAGLLYERLQREARFAHPLGGMLLGALAALLLVPFAIVGWMRAHGAPEPFWIIILALLLMSCYHALQAAQDQPGRIRRLELMAGLLALNSLPAWALLYAGDFHDTPIDPIPIVLAVLAIHLAAGAGLTLIRRNRENRA